MVLHTSRGVNTLRQHNLWCGWKTTWLLAWRGLDVAGARFTTWGCGQQGRRISGPWEHYGLTTVSRKKLNQEREIETRHAVLVRLNLGVEIQAR